MSTDDLITIFCSSSYASFGDEGAAYYSFVIYSDGEKIEALSGEYRSGHGVTNIVAEYGVVINALHWIIDHNYKGQRIELKSSSQLLIKQINGDYGVYAEAIIPLWEEVRNFSKLFNIQYIWIPSQENADAKELARSAREPDQGIEYEQFQDHEELRWKFVLHGNVCRIHSECYIGDQWIRDQNGPYYERVFEPNFSAIHYNKFRTKFARDDEYRQQWSVKG
jgi:ribonuclease HI